MNYFLKSDMNEIFTKIDNIAAKVLKLLIKKNSSSCVL